MRIQHNIAALNSYRNLSNNNSAVSKNLEKLSSGYRINRAGDDAAGLAISEKMRAQITGLETAQKNAQDGISLVQTAEGALTEVHSMLNRMVELANQSANGTYQNEVDRENLQKEIDSLVREIDRISQSTNFNGINLLDGSLGSGSTPSTPTEIITGSMANDGIKIDNAGSPTEKAQYTIDFNGVSFGKDGKVNLKFGNFDVDVDVKAGMTAEEFAQAAADAINKSALGTDAAGASTRTGSTDSTTVTDLKFTAKADGTKIILTANKDGVDGTSGIKSDTKVVLSEAKNDGTTPSTPTEIGTPGISLDSDNNAKLGEVTFEFAKGLSNEEKKAFVEMLGSDGLELKITASAAATGATASGKITIDTAIFETLGSDFKLQFKDATGATAVVNTSTGEITIGTDSTNGTGTINAGQDMEFEITDAEGKVVGKITIGALTDTSSGGESTITITPPKTDDVDKKLASRGATGSVDFTPDTSALESFDISDIDFSKFTGTLSSDADVSLAFETSAHTLTLKIGNTTFTAAISLSSSALANETITLTSADGGSIDITFGGAVDAVGNDVNTAITEKKVGTLSPVENKPEEDLPTFAPNTDALGKFDVSEIDFKDAGITITSDTDVKMSYKDKILTIKIGDATFTSAALTSNATDLKGATIELTGADGKKITVKLDDDVQSIGKDKTEEISEVSVGKLSPASTEKPSDVKAGDKYEMDFSTLSNPKNGDKLVIGDITVTFQDGQAAVALANGTSINVTIGKDINETIKNLADELNKDANFSKEWKVTADNGKLTFEAQKDGVSIPKVGSGTTWQGADKITAKPSDDNSTPTLPSDGIILQIGDSSADYNRITVTIGDMSAASLGIDGLDISTQEAALASIDKIKNAINIVSATRGDLGAIQNRLEHTINNLSVTTENMTAAESRIRDVDMAKEMMAYTKNNILVQSSQAMLAQANQIPQGVLQLLQ